jgi:hypothetical protein
MTSAPTRPISWARAISSWFRRAGFEIRRQTNLGVPIEALNRGGHDNNAPAAALAKLEHLAVEAWPTLFAFQFPTWPSRKTSDRA